MKDNAIEVNTTLSDVIRTHGRILDFGLKAHAEAYASQLSAGDRKLQIQAAPANDPCAVDAYLLADHTPSIAEPTETDGKTWTFNVGSNLYGALGEAILTSGSKPYALYYFVRENLELNENDLESGLALEVERGRPISVNHPDGEKRWTPGCIVRTTGGWDGCVLAKYYYETKLRMHRSSGHKVRSDGGIGETKTSGEHTRHVNLLGIAKNVNTLREWYEMTYTDYAETGTKCSLCGKKMFKDKHEIDGEQVCSEWCLNEYRRRNGITNE